MNDQEKQQHIVPGGPEFGYFQSDDLWTPQQVEQWKKNWLSDARPEPEVVATLVIKDHNNVPIKEVPVTRSMMDQKISSGETLNELVNWSKLERDSSEDQAKTHMLVNFIKNRYNIDVVWRGEYWDAVRNENDIQHRILKNNDPLI